MGVITLLTDFGYRDPYVGIMKGVIYSVNPNAVIVDITHTIPMGDVKQASFVLSHSFKFFPPETVHTVVVDPGVGSARRILGVETADYIFVAPDNGVLTPIFDFAKVIVNITNERFFLSEISRTFHGRDIFAPVAGALSRGVKLLDLGEVVDHPMLIPQPKLVEEAGRMEGEVIYIDGFGNVITNIPGSVLDGEVKFEINGRLIERKVQCYDEGGDDAFAIQGSFGCVEFSVKGGSAKQTLQASVGMPVIVHKGG